MNPMPNYSALPEEIKSSQKAPKFNVGGDRVRIAKYIFIKSYTEIWSKEIFVIASLLKPNSRTYKIKDLNRETIKGSFYEECFCCQVNYK